LVVVIVVVVVVVVVVMACVRWTTFFLKFELLHCKTQV